MRLCAMSSTLRLNLPVRRTGTAIGGRSSMSGMPMARRSGSTVACGVAGLIVRSIVMSAKMNKFLPSAQLIYRNWLLEGLLHPDKSHTLILRDLKWAIRDAMQYGRQHAR